MEGQKCERELASVCASVYALKRPVATSLVLGWMGVRSARNLIETYLLTGANESGVGSLGDRARDGEGTSDGFASVYQGRELEKAINQS